MGDGILGSEELQAFREAFAADPASQMAQNAVTRASIEKVALVRDKVSNTGHTFSTLLDDWKVTNQRHSGRCWLFAGLNLLRVPAMRKMGLKDFEFSQNHAMFWDKIERANYALEAFIASRDRDLDDRTVAYLLDSLADDGGQWNMFVALIRKHGLVPKEVMPETESSSNTRRMNEVIRTLLRQGVKTVREAGRRSLDDARAEKEAILRTIYRVLCIHLGTPPDRFLWQWVDKDRNFHRDGVLTPAEFASRYIELPLDDYVCLVNDPRPTSPLGRTFTVEYLGNVVGAPPVRYLNVEVGLMKEIASSKLLAGEPVWFGCDVGKMMSTEYGIWDADLYALTALYGADFTLAKSDRLLYHESAMTHAMLFTGVDIVDGVPRRWRVENSWGAGRGRKGFYAMNDSWFAEYVFEIAAPRESLPAQLQQSLELEPIVLPAWDPMGALARGNASRL
jgi:bleomycin hydrolase